ncbi:conserved protein of unknown function [uncultured Sphingopyxis sp.]|uniref:Uncharacterized protein n=1 Tax=uncultured Sphingopyxis sp. TaxID=310581 RepID=A0A1Y5PRS4_9SPHN|nr:TIR domain-containing protein [uncultured Sphingopyxis sp.]SBV32690.1 conserved protein of unknown function [uncultured Sphingopyxis sp.]
MPNSRRPTTYERPWVLHEIKRSHELRKGLLAIDLFGVKYPQTGIGTQGSNPLSYWQETANGVEKPFTALCKTYSWVNDDGYRNMPTWIETAAIAAGR